jgi:GNAT superfamily N-acetyltransferase
MPKSSILRRLGNYYQKGGLLKTFRRVVEYPYRVIFKNKRLLVYAELKEVDDSVLTLPPGIIVDRKTSYDEAFQPDMQKMIDYWNREGMIDRIKERFAKNTTLWIIRLNGEIAGFVWTISGKVLSPWYLPLTPHDAYVLDAVTFEEFRGRGLYAVLMNYVLGKLKSEGMSRVVGELYTTNTSSIRGLKRTYYRTFGVARRFHAFGRNITIWSQGHDNTP